jgi:DNA-directed RNA polymerase subunit K/omega
MPAGDTISRPSEAVLEPGAAARRAATCYLLGMADVELTESTSPASAPASDPAERAEPIESRFLFVDVAAQRAKQLRRGALPRLQREAGASRKLERLAMEEVRKGHILYTLPPQPARRGGA